MDDLAEIGRGVESAGTSVRDAMHTAADSVGSLPIVGGQLGDALREAGDSATGQAVTAGQEGQERERTDDKAAIDEALGKLKKR